jgi:hypothetical protein
MTINMDNQAMTTQEGAEHFLFFQKSEKILKYLKDIGKFLSWEERRVLDDAAGVITKLMDSKMNCQSISPNDQSKSLKQ